MLFQAPDGVELSTATSNAVAIASTFAMDINDCVSALATMLGVVVSFA